MISFTVTIDLSSKVVTWTIFDEHGTSQGTGTAPSMGAAAGAAIAAMKTFVQSKAASLTAFVPSVS